MSGAEEDGTQRQSGSRPRELSAEERRRSRIVSAVVRRGLRQRARDLRRLSNALLAVIVTVFLSAVGYLIWFQVRVDQNQIDLLRQQTLQESERQRAVIEAGQTAAQTALKTQRDRLLSPILAQGRVEETARFDSGTSNNLVSVHFPDDGQRGWAVGERGTILTSGDGGETWAAQASGTKSNLLSVRFATDGQRGWAVGDEGTIRSTGDGGKTWEGQTSNTQNHLVSVRIAADGQRGWAVGFGGTILATSDGGQNWAAQASGTTDNLVSAQFAADGQHGWAAGARGTILASGDGGRTWAPQTSGTTNTLLSVYFAADGEHGWAVGERGTIAATVDGGGTWVPQTSGTADYLVSVHFAADGQRGWAVGARGKILVTGDGGRTWASQTSGTTNELRSVQIRADGRRGWAVGDGGTRLRIDPPDLSRVRKAETLDELRQALRAVNTDEAKIGETFDTYRTLDANRAAFESQLRSLDANIAQLKLQLGAKAGAVTGTTSATAPKEFDWDKVFNLVSRLAVVSVVMFLISILVTIYRYNSRLAAHYDARADALGLAEAILPRDFHRLVEALAASRLDFGKMDRQPVEKLLEITAAALRRGR